MYDCTRHYINGEWVESSAAARHDIINPATEESIGQVAYGTAEELEAAYICDTSDLDLDSPDYYLNRELTWLAFVDRVRHAKYNKFVLRTKKLYAHDETNDVNVGDKVRVMETRPLSKNKRWRITDVLERAK